MAKKTPQRLRETDLYPAVRKWLEGRGFDVQAEVGDIDVLGVRRLPEGGKPLANSKSAEGGKSLAYSKSAEGGKSLAYSKSAESGKPLAHSMSSVGAGSLENGEDILTLAVELKTRLSLELLFQGSERLDSADLVYIAFPAGEKRARLKGAKQLCRRLGIGILTVALPASWANKGLDPGARVPMGTVREVLAPSERKIRNNAAKRALLKEFGGRRLNVNSGGTNGKKMTKYRETALAILFYMDGKEAGEPTTMRELKSLGVENPSSFLYQNYYGWFDRAERGSYFISEEGRRAVVEFAQFRNVLDTLK